MVVSLGPGKFYGSSLPRPRFYTDVKFNDERVDPPAPLLDPLLSWAADAHWSMGGLSYKRLRLQGKIEGNVKKLQKEREKIQKKNSEFYTPIASIGADESEFEDDLSDSPPPTPIVIKRKRRFALLEEDEDEDEVVEFGSKKRSRLIRKLGDDFDMVADDAPAKNLIASRTRSKRSEIEVEEPIKPLKKKKVLRKRYGSASPVSTGSPKAVRTSPRTSKA